MELFKGMKGYRAAEVEIVLIDTEATDQITVRAIDEGAGHFIELTATEKTRIDAEDLLTLAQSCAELCTGLDAIANEDHKQPLDR